MGKATVAALSDYGMEVVMLCRDRERGEKAYVELMEEKERKIYLMFCDLADMDSVRNFCEEFHESLINWMFLLIMQGLFPLQEKRQRWYREAVRCQSCGTFSVTMLLLDKMSPGGGLLMYHLVHIK
jgi:NAD(P)-dependent dehydrogenase (short-subunit alcohol dehydrogenase family)